MAAAPRSSATTHHLCARCAPGASRTLGGKKKKKTRAAKTRATSQTRAG